MAIGRSKPEPSFLMSAGARLMVICVIGTSKPQFRSAARIRCRLSRTAASGKPTVWKFSSWLLVGLISTSTSMILASIPKTAALWVLKSMLASDLLSLAEHSSKSALKCRILQTEFTPEYLGALTSRVTQVHVSIEFDPLLKVPSSHSHRCFYDAVS